MSVMSNIENFGLKRGISKQDALQIFMQVILLKNLHPKGVHLIGGTALVMGHKNPRFSEDIDLTGVSDPAIFLPGIEKTGRELEGLLDAQLSISPPKSGKNTWRISCKTRAGLSAKLHIDSQPYSALSDHPLMVEYDGIAPFVFASVKVDEIMADKLIALAFRKNISARDIFDLWYHWLKNEDARAHRRNTMEFVGKKLKQRNLKKKDFLDNVRMRLAHGISKRMESEWERYLPAGLKNRNLHELMFLAVQDFTAKIKL